MPNELPAFLQEFMKHRKHVTKSDPTPLQSKTAALQPASKTKDLDLSVAGIIEKKPNRKVLDEFLQKRCDELTKVKLAKS